MSQVHGYNQLVTFTVNDATIPAYRIVAPAAGNGRVATWVTATSLMIGVSQDESKGATGTSVLVCVNGFAKLQAGASVSAGAVVTGQTATGLGIERTLNNLNLASLTTSTIPHAIGVAIDAADTNSVFEILVQPTLMRITGI